MQISNIQTGIGLDAGNFEVTFPICRRRGRSRALLSPAAASIDARPGYSK
jgi:hypothetical protein